MPPTAGLPATGPAPPGGISRVKPQLEELNHQGGKKDPLPIFCRRRGNAGTIPPPPEPPPPAAPARASVTATEPARERHRPVGHRGVATTPGQSWARGTPRRGPTVRQKVMQPFCKAAALGRAVVIGANEEGAGFYTIWQLQVTCMLTLCFL